MKKNSFSGCLAGLFLIGFVGVALMIIATWFLIVFAQYESYLFFIKKGLIKAKEEREP